MLTNDLKGIILMRPVQRNYNLKKFQRDKVKNSVSGIADLQDSGDVDGITTAGGSRGFMNDTDEWPRRDENTWNGVPFTIRTQFNSPVKRLIAEAYVRFRIAMRKPLKDPVEIFDEVKDNFMELASVDVDKKEMQDLLRKLEITKQRNVVTEVKQKAVITELESVLYKNGFKQYQTEESLINFIVKCKKGLCLTEIDNFDRVIPDDVAEKFNKAEQLKVFDNYYILHYDKKKGANPFYTEKEKPKPRDPILFGVIQGSEKLYFIADWIDEFCDLTYKDILKEGTDFKIKKQN